jgi:hypothetical protein
MMNESGADHKTLLIVVFETTYQASIISMQDYLSMILRNARCAI